MGSGGRCLEVILNIGKFLKKCIVSIFKLSYSIGKQFCLVQAFISRKKQEKFKPEINK